MGCATSIVKYLLFLFNLIFVFVGIAVISLGMSYKLKLGHYAEFIGTFDAITSQFPLVLIFCGLVILIIAFFGCCGAIRESICMLLIYSGVLVAMFVFQLSIAIYLIAKTKFQDEEEELSFKIELVYEMFNLYFTYDISSTAKIAIDTMQHEMKCCGVEKPSDWMKVWPNTTVAPASCCENKPPICHLGEAFHDGCADILYENVQKGARALTVAFMISAFFELTAGVIGFCVANAIRVEDQVYDYED